MRFRVIVLCLTAAAGGRLRDSDDWPVRTCRLRRTSIAPPVDTKASPDAARAAAARSPCRPRRIPHRQRRQAARSRSTRTSSSHSPCRFGPTGGSRCPLVGDLDAADQTPVELRDTITTALKEYVTNPTVTVIVVEATAAIAYVMGEVNHPGAVTLQGGPLTVLQALAMAGGFKDFADINDIRVLRRTPAGVQTISVQLQGSDSWRSARCTCGPATPLSCPTEVSMSHPGVRRWRSRSP